MGVGWILAMHGLATATVVIFFLCGNWPIFRRTPIAAIHRFLTYGAYDYFLVRTGSWKLRTSAVIGLTPLFSVFITMVLAKFVMGGCRTPRHFLICVYRVVAIGLVIAEELKESRIIQILTVYYGIENSVRSLAPRVLQWMLGSYDTQILVMVFLAIVSLLLAGFFGYHAGVCLTNTTTNETFKWQEYISWKRKINEARASSDSKPSSVDYAKRKTPRKQVEKLLQKISYGEHRPCC